MTRTTVILLALSSAQCARSDQTSVDVTVTASADAAIVQFEFAIEDLESGTLIQVRLPDEPAGTLTSRRFGFGSDALAGRDLVARVSGFDGKGDFVDSAELSFNLIEDQSLELEIELAADEAVDGGIRDAGSSDGGALDGGAMVDAGALDASTPDAGALDAATVDPVDAGPVDAALVDASMTDASADAGQIDASAFSL